MPAARPLAAAELATLGPAAVALVLLRAGLQVAAGASGAVTLAAFGHILAGASHAEIAWRALAVWAAAQIAANGATAADPLLMHVQDHLIGLRRGRDLLRRTAALPYAAFVDPAGIEATDRARRAAAGASDAYTAVMDSLNALAAAVSFAVLLVSFSPWLPALTAMAVVPLARARWKNAGDLHTLENADGLHRRRAAHLAGLHFDRHGQAELRLLGVGALLLRRWRRETARSDRLALRAIHDGLVQSILPHGAAAAGILAAGALLCWLHAAHHLTAAQLITAILTAIAAVGSQQHVGDDLASIRHSLLRLADHHRLPLPPAAAPAPPADAARETPPALGPPPTIRLEGVSYRYPSAGASAVREVTCTLRAGEHVAVVGENGSGKTTFLLLLMGLLEPTAGTIWYGDRRLDGYDPAAPAVWSAVFADFVRYAGLTVGENVSLGAATRRGGPWPAPWLATGLRAAEHRPVGKAYTGGIDLSGGQWQRLAVARALRRAGEPGTWFACDEATAALDPIAEAELLDRIWDALRGHGALLVSHRLGFARRADRVLVFEAGRIVQDGPHDRLTAVDGPYRRLFTAQAGALGVES